MWEPMINCGLWAGNNPLCWDGEYFETKQECDEWIHDNQDNFTMEEIGGCVYSSKVP